MNRRTDQALMLTRLQNRILARKGLVGCGPEFTVALHSRGKAVYAGSDRWGQGGCTHWEGVSALACTGDRVMALMQDGTLQVAGKQPVDAALRGLSHVRTVNCCGELTAALLGNGRVIVSGTSRRASALDTAEWPAVTDVVCGTDFTLGLTPAGRVTVAGGSRRLRHLLGVWDGIAGLFTDYEGETVYGITVEGRLLSTRPLPHDARSWKNLIFMAAAGGISGALPLQVCSVPRLPPAFLGIWDEVSITLPVPCPPTIRLLLPATVWFSRRETIPSGNAVPSASALCLRVLRSFPLTAGRGISAQPPPRKRTRCALPRRTVTEAAWPAASV